jgi:hypothetical protein
MTKEKGQKDKEKLEDTKEVIKSRKLITFLVPSSFSLSFCLFSFVIVLSVVLLFTASDYLFGIFKLLFVFLSFFFCKEKGQKEKEKLEDTKGVNRSCK